MIERQGSDVAANVVLREGVPDPVPGPGEALVAVEASALNQLDLWVGRGVPGLDLDYPRVSGSDGCGRVVALGTGVDDAWLGRRVILNAAIERPERILPGAHPARSDREMIGEHRWGTMAERFAAPVANLLDVGETDPVEAAAFGLVHLTAWRMLVSRARLRQGSIVLVTGIGGGVALAALGIARHFGCRAIVTSRSEEKLERARELGAEAGVLDDGGDWSRQVRALTGKRGVDVVVDSIGKAVHLAGVKSLARGGVYVTCGCTTGPDAITDLARVFWNELSILGSTMGDMEEFREVVALLVSGALRPVVDSVHPATEAAGAYARLQSAAQFGKVVLHWDA